MINKVPVLISACLLGIRCRYDHNHAISQSLLEHLDQIHPVPVCPEQLGGLPTPRAPADIKGGDGNDVLKGRGRLITTTGQDVTDQFLRGAQETLRIAKVAGTQLAFLKDKSPSCGLNTPHCDKPEGHGIGVTAALLVSKGFHVIELAKESRFPMEAFLNAVKATMGIIETKIKGE